MKPELEDKIYQGILRNVIWGAEREQVLHTLKVNGICGEKAEEMFRRAQQERVRQIRSDAVRKALLGTVILLAAVGLYCGFWYGFGAITRAVFVISAAVAAWGTWWLVDGVVTALMAPSRKGSISPQ